MTKAREVVRGFSLVMLFIMVLGQVSFAQIGVGSNGSPGAIPQTPNASPLKLNVTLHGRGASFPAPLLFNWTLQYHKDYPNTTLTYASVGSGAGQNALFNKTSDFSASDAPLNANQRLLAPNVLHIPETIGSVVLAYNLTGIPKGLNLTGALIAQIYLGQVYKWNDPAIQNINPSFVLPNHNITTVHRSDGSGTTFVFTSFLSLSSPTWKTTVGASTAVTWPGSATGNPLPYYLTGNGNAGVANVIATNPFTFGYVELNYALQHGFTYGYVQNPAGFYIEPTLRSTAFAVANSTSALPQGIGDWSQVSLLNAAGTQTYPIASFTYLLVYRELNVVPSMDLNETAQANALISFLKWAVHKGQTFSPGLSYVPLPSSVVALDDVSIASITFTIKSTPVHTTISLSGNAVSGWNSLTPGPTISAFSNDTITLLLSSTDTTHQFFVDFNNNNALDQNETSTASQTFDTTSGTVSFTFKPIIFNAGSVPAAGSYTYRCKFHPTTMYGTFTIKGQQAAAPFLHANTLTSSHIPVLDSSRVSIIGSFVVDLRTSTASGNLTVVAVDSVSGTVTFTKAYLVSNLAIGRTFILNAAVLPYDLGPVVTTSLTPSYTLTWRQLDFDADGSVNIVELATVGASFGTTVGGPGYKGQADLNADGVVNIVDLVLIAGHFGFTPIYH